SIDFAMPEMFAKAEARGELEDEIRVGSRLSGRSHHGAAKLDQGLCFHIDLEADLQGFALEAGCDGQHNVGERGRRGHEEIGVNIELQCGKRSTATYGVGVREQQVGSEPDQPAQRIRHAFEYRPVEVMGGYVVPARWA